MSNYVKCKKFIHDAYQDAFAQNAVDIDMEIVHRMNETLLKFLNKTIRDYENPELAEFALTQPAELMKFVHVIETHIFYMFDVMRALKDETLTIN